MVKTQNHVMKVRISSAEALGQMVGLITWTQLKSALPRLVPTILELNIMKFRAPNPSYPTSISMVEDPLQWGEEETIAVLMKKEDVKGAIDRLMDEGEEREQRKKRARKLGEIAKRDVEVGGSSYLNLTLLIQDISNKVMENQPNTLI
ncbi:hypothetical protein CMV_001382 [Castanea mollissima]|uniref:Uncharacterized protein n=1 Tax=Castanea mollissima TaxID=60419 RepID=A0A8J4S4G7_9ROSI|nr:hypothetical protein CMV_001382 [Castanea mollissima]